MGSARRRRTIEQAKRALDEAGRFMALGVPRHLAAAASGLDRATLNRWRGRLRRGEPLVKRRGPGPRPLDPEAQSKAGDLVRALAGQVGAESLRRSVPGLSRRQAAAVKTAVRHELELERRQGAARVTVSAPGILRGFDAMQFGRQASLLVSADGSVPYRTHWATTRHYDGDTVAAFLEQDLATNGSPLVLRMDRARQHDTPAVRAVLARHEVLLLQGPPRWAQYYGQLERQNREHRAWLRSALVTDDPGPEPRIPAMINALNNSWRRRTLGWQTAAEVWNGRSPVRVDRRDLREEVEREARRLRRHKALRGRDRGWAQRIAIKHALVKRGLLRLETGGWC